MASIDLIDGLSLLLGAAIAVLAVSTVGARLLGADAPPFTRVLVMAGLALILGYALSEVLHALRPPPV